MISMPLRRFTVDLELHDPEIFYHWNYDPPIANIGGGLGTIRPGGSLYNVHYETLRALGNGTHPIELDSSVSGLPGPVQNIATQDDELLRRVRFALFAYPRGAITPSSVLCTLLQSITPSTVEQIVPLLSESHLTELTNYAKGIGATKAERNHGNHLIITSAGTILIPDENLVTIRARFGGAAAPTAQQTT